MSWLWKNDVSSPASFEKALSKLATQITATQINLEATRSRARRIMALWTIYTVVTYIVYSLVLVLVLDTQKWSIPHYAGLVGSPFVIYGVRLVMALIVDWQTGRQQSHLENLQKQRESKIQDLKKATKFDSTQELLQKYGGGQKPTPSKQPQQGTKRKITAPREPTRTGIAPPPTANIPGRNLGPGPATQQRPESTNIPVSPLAIGSPMSAGPVAKSFASVLPEDPGFAPNAYSDLAPPRSAYDQPSRWYDRILDVLLGDDETLAKNRLALICLNCRMVNGQAPPGVKSPQEVGKWRCSSCGSWNGEEQESATLVREIVENSHDEKQDAWENTLHGNEDKPTETSQHTLIKDTPSRREIPDSDDDPGNHEVGSEGNTREEEDEYDGSATRRRVTRSTRNKLGN